MSRRLTPYLFVSLLGVISGVYIFKPLFEETSVKHRTATDMAANPADGPQSPADPALQQGK